VKNLTFWVFQRVLLLGMRSTLSKIEPYTTRILFEKCEECFFASVAECSRIKMRLIAAEMNRGARGKNNALRCLSIKCVYSNEVHAEKTPYLRTRLLHSLVFYVLARHQLGALETI